MSDATAKRAKVEAAAWFAKLGQVSISTQALRDFRDWKQDATNARAYAEIEAMWDASKNLAHDRDLRVATDEALRKNPPRRGPGGKTGPAPTAILAAGFGAAGLIALGVWVASQQPATYSTTTGEQRLVTLEDGSRVRLNTDTTLKVRFRAHERDLTLARGEAFFEAAHDPARPFLVTADGAQVRALGTRFDVRADPGRVRVTLLEGRVRVTAPNAAPATLIPNQQVTLTNEGLSPAQTVDAAEASSWTTGRLVFRNLPLAAAVAEVNRYAAHKIVLDAPALAARPVTGTFETGDTQAFLQAAQSLFGLTATRAPDGRLRLAPAAAPAPPPHA